MTMIEWAENEIRLACNTEEDPEANDEKENGCNNYVLACHESALKAFKSLMDDGHSGMSYNITVGILKRLIEGKPLTPIYDTPDEWTYEYTNEDGVSVYQCIRMPGLFKRVDQNGTVTYKDLERCRCYLISNRHLRFVSRVGSRVLDTYYPITMPYYPPLGYYEIEMDEFLTDRVNGDFDTVACWSITEPGGNVIMIDEYYGEVNGEMVKITRDEFLQRKSMHVEREKLEREKLEREKLEREKLEREKLERE